MPKSSCSRRHRTCLQGALYKTCGSPLGILRLLQPYRSWHNPKECPVWTNQQVLTINSLRSSNKYILIGVMSDNTRKLQLRDSRVLCGQVWGEIFIVISYNKFFYRVAFHLGLLSVISITGLFYFRDQLSSLLVCLTSLTMLRFGPWVFYSNKFIVFQIFSRAHYSTWVIKITITVSSRVRRF